MKVSGLALVVIVVSGVALGVLIAWVVDTAEDPDPVPAAVMRDDAPTAEAADGVALPPRGQVDVVLIDGDGEHVAELVSLGYDQLSSVAATQPIRDSVVLFAPGDDLVAERLVDDLGWADVIPQPLDSSADGVGVDAEADVVVQVGTGHG